MIDSTLAIGWGILWLIYTLPSRTLAAALSVASILGEPLTFYRIHGGNLYQTSGFNKDTVRRKQRSLEALISGLFESHTRCGIPRDTLRTLIEPVQAEADMLRLQNDGGFPWETVRAEWLWYRIVHEDAPLPHRCFKFLSLAPVLLLPPRLYYQIRRSLAGSDLYVRARRMILPVPEPQHVIRSRRSAS